MLPPQLQLLRLQKLMNYGMSLQNKSPEFARVDLRIVKHSYDTTLAAIQCGLTLGEDEEFRESLAQDGVERNPLLRLYEQSRELERIPYFERTIEERMGSYALRDYCVREFAWAIPDDDAIQTILKYGPILEIGAGLGYWAALINKAGGDIIAYDKHVGPKNSWFKGKQPYFPIKSGGSGAAVKRHPDRTLMMVWPCYDKPMDVVALRQHKGEYLIYVGESSYGCTGSPAGHNWIEKYYEEVEEVLIHRWPSIHDYMTVYRRKNFVAGGI